METEAVDSKDYHPDVQQEIEEIHQAFEARIGALDEFLALQSALIDEQYEMDVKTLQHAFQMEKSAIINNALHDLKEQLEAVRHQSSIVCLTHQGDVLDVQSSRSHNLRRRQRYPSNVLPAAPLRHPPNIGSPQLMSPSSLNKTPERYFREESAMNLLNLSNGDVGAKVPLPNKGQGRSASPSVNAEHTMGQSAPSTTAVTSGTSQNLATLPALGAMGVPLLCCVEEFRAPVPRFFSLAVEGEDGLLAKDKGTISIPPTPVHLNTMLSVANIQKDVEELKRSAMQTTFQSGSSSERPPRSAGEDVHSNKKVWVDSDRLFYGLRCFTRGDEVFLSARDSNRITACIVSISPREIHLRRHSDRGSLKVTVQQLRTGRYTIKARRERTTSVKKT